MSSRGRNIVIGAGLAGLSAALYLAQAGENVTLIAFGDGGMQLSQGTIDIIGYAPAAIRNPLQAIDTLAPTHPYSLLGAEIVKQSSSWLADKLAMTGNPQKNMWLPTALGALRPTAFAPESFAAADANLVNSYAVVGIRVLKDFHPELIAGNLAGQKTPEGKPITASASWIELVARAGENDATTFSYAEAIDDKSFMKQFAKAIAEAAGEGQVVLVPSVLGFHQNDSWRQISQIVGRPVAQVMMQPPSPSGRRNYLALIDAFKDAGGRFILGAKLVAKTRNQISVKMAGAIRDIPFTNLVYAPGGFESGALTLDSTGRITETTFGLALNRHDATGLINGDYFASQPLFETGVVVDSHMRVLDANGELVADNFYAAGGILSGAQRWVEKSGDGIAIASGYRAAKAIIEGTS